MHFAPQTIKQVGELRPRQSSATHSDEAAQSASHIWNQAGAVFQQRRILLVLARRDRRFGSDLFAPSSDARVRAHRPPIVSRRRWPSRIRRGYFLTGRRQQRSRRGDKEHARRCRQFLGTSAHLGLWIVYRQVVELWSSGPKNGGFLAKYRRDPLRTSS